MTNAAILAEDPGLRAAVTVAVARARPRTARACQTDHAARAIRLASARSARARTGQVANQ